MGYNINLDDDYVAAEELQLMKTRHAILEKLRARFGDYEERDTWVPGRMPEDFSAQGGSQIWK